MPRVNLGRDPTKERQEATSKIIRMAMIRQGISKQADIAVRFGRSQQWFSQKLKKGNWSLEDMYWGESEVEALYKDVVAHDNVSANMAALTFQANVNTMEIKGLEQLFSIGSGQAQRRFWNVMQAQSVLRSNYGTQLVEQGTKLTNTQYHFNGLKEVYESMCLNLCGASHYPMTKLFGRSPSGLNSTGESDLTNYYDYVDSQREAKLRPALQKLLPVLAMSAWGYIPGDLELSFPPLWTPTAKELADIAKSKAEAITSAYTNGLMNVDTAQKELRKLEEETGMFGSITDEEIAANAGKSYQDMTALRDPLMGLELGGEGAAPFDGAARDAAAMDYNPYRDPKTGRYTNGPGKASTAGGKRGTLSMSSAERRRVSSGILTDHPNLQPGEISDYFFDQHYYRFVVNGPGSYRFTMRIPIVGNEKTLKKLTGGE